MKNKKQIHPQDLNMSIPGRSTRLVYICASTAMGIALLSLIGWVSGVRVLAGQWGTFIPMSPLATLSFLLLSGVLFSYTRSPRKRTSRFFALAAISVVLFSALIMLGQFLTGIDLGIEKVLLPINESLNQIPVGRISPITVVSFLLVSISFLFLLIKFKRRISSTIATLFAMSVILINFIIFVGYAYKAPLLYSGGGIPVAFFTAITFIFIGMGLFGVASRGLPGLQRWNHATFRGILLRAFLPFILVFTLLEGWVNTFFGPTLIDPVIFHSVSAIMASVLALGIISWISERTGAAFEKLQSAINELSRFPDENPNPVLRVARDGHLLYANPSSQRLLDLWKCKLIGDALPNKQSRLIKTCITSGIIPARRSLAVR